MLCTIVWEGHVVNSAYDFRILRVLRRRLGLTLHGLAGRAGLTCPTVESVEAGEYLAVHLPKDIRIIERLLEGKSEDSAESR